MTDYVSFIPKRSLGGFVANVTVEEAHQDRLTITRHPVEQGAQISDHAYKEPAAVTIKAGWSNSSAAAGGDPSYIRAIYAQLLELQATREPFSIVTGKRVYENMLFSSLAVTTDEVTETTLLLTAACEEVIIVETQAVTVPPRDVQADPAKTAATANAGTKQVQPAPQANTSALAALAGG